MSFKVNAGMVNDVNIAVHPINLHKHVKFLTGIAGFRNYQNTRSQKKIRKYIRKHFKQAGLVAKEQVFEYEGNEYANVVGLLNGNKSQIIVIGAHYDVCGNQPGADDNASGVAGL